MLPWLIALGIGTVLIVANWDKITGWLRYFIPKLEAAWKELREYMPHGAKIFGDLIMEGGKRLSRIMHKLYYKDNGQWMEETTVRKVDANDVPADIRAKIERMEARAQQADITEEIEEELQLEV